MRRIAVVVAGVIVVVAATLLIAGANQRFHGRLPADTLATTESQAEDVAFTVASNAGCGAFDSEYADRDPWRFECTIDYVYFQIFVYGSDQSRSADLARLQADGRPYVTKAYYAVTSPRQGVDKFAVMSASPPPQSIMDPFR
jgi:hypothetical protein